MGDRPVLSALLSVLMGSLIFLNSGLAAASPLTPANDEFEDAKDITSLPYNEIANNLAATDQTDEPKACASLGKTIWYRLTLPNDQIVRVETTTTGWGIAAVYRGSSLDTLGTVNCGSSDWGIRFAAKAGVTHYIQIGGIDAAPVVGNINIESISGIAGRVTNHLDAAAENHCVTLYDTVHRTWGRAYTRIASIIPLPMTLPEAICSPNSQAGITRSSSDVFGTRSTPNGTTTVPVFRAPTSLASKPGERPLESMRRFSPGHRSAALL